MTQTAGVLYLDGEEFIVFPAGTSIWAMKQAFFDALKEYPDLASATLIDARHGKPYVTMEAGR